MIWMDALDIPTIYSIGGTFFEPYADGLETPSVQIISRNSVILAAWFGQLVTVIYGGSFCQF